MIELYTTEASYSFLFAIIFGFCAGLLYDIFSVLRWSFPKKLICFFCDFIFCIVSSLALYLFCIAFLSGQFRAFALIGVAGGFCVYRMLLSVFVRKILIFFVRQTISLIRFILKPVATLLKKLNFTKKIAKKLKKLLKYTYMMMYNTIVNIKFKGRRRNSHAEALEEVENYFV